jgi:hypothetical protein
MGFLSSRRRSGAVYPLLEWLQLEYRVPRRQIVECFHRRSLWDGKEALHLAGEAVKIGFENRWTLAGRELAHGIAVAAHRASEDDFACRADIAHPIGFTAGGDQVAPPIEVKRVHRERDCLAALSSANFENVEVAANQANPDEKNKCTTQDAFDGLASDSLGHPRASIFTCSNCNGRLSRRNPSVLSPHGPVAPSASNLPGVLSGVSLFSPPRPPDSSVNKSGDPAMQLASKCDFSGIFHRYILMGDSAKLAHCGRCRS